MRHIFDLDGVSHHVWMVRQDRFWRVSTDAGEAVVAFEEQGANRFRLTSSGVSEDITAVVDGDTVHVHLGGRAFALRYRNAVDFHAAEVDAGGHDVARAPMPGGVLSVQATVGAHVRTGETLLTIESMKMETAIKAGRDGTVEDVHVVAGQMIERDAPLVTLRRDEG